MPRIEKTVFISYRRTNVPWVLAISQSLTHNGFDVFFDYNGLAGGDFETVFLENIHARAHFLVLLTPSALEKCGTPGDWLRREIEAALDSKRNIVPLMLEGFDFGTSSIANQLTGKLASLPRYNAMTVSAEYFDAAMDKLRNKFLNVAVETDVQPPSPLAAQVATEAKAAAAEAPTVAEEELTAQQWFERGNDAYEHQSFDVAVRFFSNATRLKPDFAEAFNNRGGARTKLGDLDGAIADFHRAFFLDPAYVDAIINCGSEHYEKGDYERAIEYYDRAISLDPDSISAFYNRGLARYGRGDLQGALNDYNEAVRLNPNHANAFKNRGVARQATNDLEGALADYNEAIRLSPDAGSFNNRGAALVIKGDLDSALADFNESIRLKPDHALSIKNRELVLRALADRSKP